MQLPDVKPEWRTATVTGLCLSMREAQDWSAMPILADALQDAGCPDGDPLLVRLRGLATGYAERAGLVGCVLSAETAEAVDALVAYHDAHDCPRYETLVNAATGNHDENRDPNDPSYIYTESTDRYLHFNGTDAHGAIPPDFWELVQKATGMRIPDDDRPRSFSCSC